MTESEIRLDERRKVCAEVEAEVQRLREDGENDLRSVLHCVRALCVRIPLPQQCVTHDVPHSQRRDGSWGCQMCDGG